jgi:hypothetical protein
MSEKEVKEDLINMPEMDKFNLVKNTLEKLQALKYESLSKSLEEIQKIKDEMANNNKKLQILNEIMKKAKVDVEKGTLKEDFFYRMVNTIVKANFSDMSLKYLELFTKISDYVKVDPDSDRVYLEFNFILGGQELLNFANVKIMYLPNFNVYITFPHVESTTELLKDIYAIVLQFEQLLKS